MALFYEGQQYPPQDSIERLAKYYRSKKIYDGKQAELYDRASELLKDTPIATQLRTLFIACNVIDVIINKSADMLIGEPPIYESGYPDDTREQQALNSLVEENDINPMLHEIVVGAGIRGDSWVKPYYATRHDMSEIPTGYPVPDASPEAVIEPIDASLVFPELAKGSRKKFKAVNITYVEWVETRDAEIPFLVNERHVPGYIIYERYRLYEKGVDTTYDAPIQTFTIGEKVATGLEEDVVETGVPRILVSHIPFKTVDYDWQGCSAIEKLESVLAAINDRLVMIDYVIHRNGSPTAYGPSLDFADGGDVRLGHVYIPVEKDEAKPGYLELGGALDAAFKELEVLLRIVYQMSETPDWLMGTPIVGDGNQAGGTSHTTSGSIKARYMPILSKVKRIRTHVDRGIRDAIWNAICLQNFANDGVDSYEPVEEFYPVIQWKDGVPRDEKEFAEVMQIRTGGKPTLDVQTAIKKLDEVDDMQAKEIISRIESDEKTANGFVDASIFNTGTGGSEVAE